MKKSSISQNILELCFPLLKPKVVYLRPFSSSLQFPKFWKQNFMNFRHKHIENGPNCSHGLATCFKYHMPLTGVFYLLFGLDVTINLKIT